MLPNRKEALARIFIAIVSGIVLGAWSVLIKVFMIIQLVLGIFVNKRNRDIAEFSEIWNTQAYVFVRYITFVTNERPFPFSKMAKSMSKFK